MMEPSVLALDLRFVLLAGCVALAYTAEAAIGFGSVVIALTLGAHLYSVPALLPVLVPLSLILASLMTARNWRHIDAALVGRRVLPRMAAGVALGLALFMHVPGAWLTPLLGGFVVAAAGLELVRAVRGNGAPAPPLGPLAFTSTTLAAGVVHGMTASGGPLLVYAFGRLGLDKARFRASLSVVWLILGVALAITYLASGRLDGSALVSIAALVPVVALALTLGDWLHRRLDEQAFRKIVLLLLCGAGTALIF